MPSAVAVPVSPASTQIIHTVTTSVTARTPSARARTAAAGLRDDQELALVDTVGQRAAPGAEEQHRSELQADRDPEVQGAAREAQDQPVLGHGLHPGAAHRDDLAEEVEPVVVDAQGAERAAQEAGAGRGRRGGHGPSVPGARLDRRARERRSLPQPV